VTTIAAPDIRQALFAPIECHRIRAALIADDPGVLAGVRPGWRCCRPGPGCRSCARRGRAVRAASRFCGYPGPDAGCAGRRTSHRAAGQALRNRYRGRAFVARAAGRPRIVSGAWKKLPSVRRHDSFRHHDRGGEPRSRLRHISTRTWWQCWWCASHLAVVAGLPARRTIIQLGGRGHHLGRVRRGPPAGAGGVSSIPGGSRTWNEWRGAACSGPAAR